MNYKPMYMTVYLPRVHTLGTTIAYPLNNNYVYVYYCISQIPNCCGEDGSFGVARGISLDRPTPSFSTNDGESDSACVVVSLCVTSGAESGGVDVDGGGSTAELLLATGV